MKAVCSAIWPSRWSPHSLVRCCSCSSSFPLCTVALKHRARKLAEGSGEQKAPDKQQAHSDTWFDKLRNSYERSLGRSERHRKLILVVSLVLIVVSLSLTESVAIGKQIE